MVTETQALESIGKLKTSKNLPRIVDFIRKKKVQVLCTEKFNSPGSRCHLFFFYNSRPVFLGSISGEEIDTSYYGYIEKKVGEYIFIPEIRVDEINRTTVNGIHAVDSTIITMNNANNELDHVEPNLYYGFKDGAAAAFYRKVTAVDTGANTVTLDSGLPTGGVADGTSFGLTDRVIGQKANQIASSIINWTSPPQFFGDGINYLKLTISNEDTVDAGLVTAMINGWHTDSTTGD